MDSIKTFKRHYDNSKETDRVYFDEMELTGYYLSNYSDPKRALKYDMQYNYISTDIGRNVAVLLDAVLKSNKGVVECS